jgi:hypothetical protein
VFHWDGKRLKELRTLPCRLGLVGAVVYSPDGKFLAASGTDGFHLWNARTLQLVRTVATPAQQLAFAPDSQTLYAATLNDQPKSVHKITRWNVAGKKACGAPGPAAGPDWSQPPS